MTALREALEGYQATAGRSGRFYLIEQAKAGGLIHKEGTPVLICGGVPYLAGERIDPGLVGELVTSPA